MANPHLQRVADRHRVEYRVVREHPALDAHDLTVLVDFHVDGAVQRLASQIGCWHRLGLGCARREGGNGSRDHTRSQGNRSKRRFHRPYSLVPVPHTPPGPRQITVEHPANPCKAVPLCLSTGCSPHYLRRGCLPQPSARCSITTASTPTSRCSRAIRASRGNRPRFVWTPIRARPSILPRIKSIRPTSSLRARLLCRAPSTRAGCTPLRAGATRRPADTAFKVTTSTCRSDRARAFSSSKRGVVTSESKSGSIARASDCSPKKRRTSSRCTVRTWEAESRSDTCACRSS